MRRNNCINKNNNLKMEAPLTTSPKNRKLTMFDLDADFENLRKSDACQWLGTLQIVVVDSLHGRILFVSFL